MPESVPVALGARARELRRYRGLTQERLAARAGISRDVVTKLEQRVRTSARIDTLGRVAAALGVPLIALFDAEQEHEPPPRARNCAGSAGLLSRYNPGDMCLPCVDVAAGSEVASLRREAAELRAEVAWLRCEARELAEAVTR